MDQECQQKAWYTVCIPFQSMKYTEVVGTGKDFLNGIQIAQAVRPTVYKWCVMKLKGKIHYHSREKADYRMGMTSASYTSDRRLVSRIYKKNP